MAGSVTFTEVRISSMRLVKAEWTSDGSGDVSGSLTTNRFSGQCVQLTTAPGVPAPATPYNLEVLDEDGNDLARGQATVRSTTLRQYLNHLSGASTPAMGVVVMSKLTIVVDTAGASKQGTCWIFIKE